MSNNRSSRFSGRIVIPEGQGDSCWKKLLDFLTRVARIEFLPQGLDFVTICKRGVDVDVGGSVCAQLDENGKWDGLRKIANGTPVQVPAITDPNYIHWFSGDATAILPGFALADGLDGRPNRTKDFEGSAPNYSYYGAVWVGI